MIPLIACRSGTKLGSSQGNGGAVRSLPSARPVSLPHRALREVLHGTGRAQLALERLTAILEADGLPYAIIGAFALNEYGHRRVTVGVDLVMRDEHLQEFKRTHLGRGYAERVPGTGKLLDTELGVNIDVLSTGRFPGDDKPKPIAFPDPAVTALRGSASRSYRCRGTSS